MQIPETSNIFLYGRGVFTTVPVICGDTFLWKKHWHRLIASALILEIDLTEFNEQFVFQKLADKIREGRILNGRSRITFSDLRSGSNWPTTKGVVNKTRLQITTGDRRSIPDNFKLTVSPFQVNSRSPLAGIKSCNYLEQLMSSDEAKARGFHEAVRVNERGVVTSGCMSNVFWLRDDKLYTPSLNAGCLPGTTREYVLDYLECREVEAEIEELNSADAIYLTSAGLGITPVAEYNGNKLQNLPHPITQLLTMN